MKIVVVDSKESQCGSLAVIVPEKDLWAFEVLLASAGKKALSVSDLHEAEAAVRREYSHAG